MTCRCLLALAALAVAAGQDCFVNFTVTLHNFNKAGAGANGNPDFGFLPEPANVSDKKIVKATLSAAKKPVYSPATGFNTTTTHSEPPAAAPLHVSETARLSHSHVPPKLPAGALIAMRQACRLMRSCAEAFTTQ